MAPVGSLPNGTQSNPLDSIDGKQHQNSTVIIGDKVIRQQMVHQLEPPNGFRYATQIDDLRALTNYTFSVRVSQFFGQEPSLNRAGETQQLAKHQHHQQQQQQLQHRQRHLSTLLNLARKLDLFESNNDNNNDNTLKLIETKPFSAEAVNCYANSSELLVNTGRYFSGRISVEGQADARCHLMGNKSSEQSSYLFHIDHKLCHSKVIDGNRIETMILVHENKDILTHNTARFLVLCNVHQKSFTVKASISLPKIINGPGRLPARPFGPNELSSGAGAGPGDQQQQQPRAAIITPVDKSSLRLLDNYHRNQQQPAKPEGELSQQESRTGAKWALGVHLGSMPGIYRPIRVASGDEYWAGSALGQESELLTGNGSQAQHWTRAARNWRESSAEEAGHLLPEPASTTAAPLGQRFLPTPVDISSRVLYVRPVTRALTAAGPAALLQQATLSQPATTATTTATTTTTTTTTLAPLSATKRPASLSGGAAMAAGDRQERKKAALVRSENEEGGLPPVAELGGLESHSQPLVLTNNHRVAGDFLPLGQRQSSRPAASASSPPQPPQPQASHTLPQDSPAGSPPASLPDEGFSIKYSAANVIDYPLEKIVQLHRPSPTQPQSQAARSRTGRMRSVQLDDDELGQGPLAATPPIEQLHGGRHFARAPLESAEGGVSQTFVSDNSEATRRGIEDRMGDSLATRTSSTPAHNLTSSARTAAGAPQTSTAHVGRVDSGPAEQTFRQPNLQHEPSVNLTRSHEIARPTLAHNITGALLKWSLQTLGHLARKSLESLANPAPEMELESPFEEHQSSGHLELLGSQRANLQHRSDARPPLVQQQGEQPTSYLSTTTLPPKLALVEPTSSLGASSRSIVGRRLAKTGEKIVTQTTSVKPVATSPNIDSANLGSKSHSEAPPAKREEVKKSPPVASKEEQSRPDDGLAQGRVRDSLVSVERRTGSEEPPWRADDELVPRTVWWWPFYAMAIIGSLILLTLCVALVPLMVTITDRQDASLGRTSGSMSNIARFFAPRCNQMVSRISVRAKQTGPKLNLEGESIEEQRQSDDNVHNRYLSSLLTVRNSVNDSGPNQTIGTRSTSAASELGPSMSDENYCKNNEFLYTDFVLLKQDRQALRSLSSPKSGNESFA